MSELTMNPTKGTYTFLCIEHGVHRPGILTVQHAANIEAKHNREHHGMDLGQAVDVAALARLVQDAWQEWTDAIADGLDDPDVAHKATPAQRRFLVLREAWMTLLGLEDDTQVLAEAHRAVQDETTAYVAPF
jgi:hypothetical protein